MTKYLLDYRGGCKGDFLCNFVNFNDVFFVGDYKKSTTPNYNFKDGSKTKIEKILKQELVIVAGHRLDFLDKKLLQDNNCKIIKLCIENKFYQTASVEFFIKYFTTIISKVELLYLLPKKDYFKFVDTAKYCIDLNLIQLNLDLTDKNRLNFLLMSLNNATERYIKYENLKLDYPTVYKNFWYGDIYVNKKYDMLYEIKPDFDPIHYENLLEKTWLPDVVNVFGYDIDLRKYGYRNY
jgi:hypothetical protein